MTLRVRGPLWNLIRSRLRATFIIKFFKAVSKIAAIAEGIPIVGVGGLEKIEYPPVAIHEIVTNAVLHRDYSLNDDVHVRIFDNRIEVESPDVLPAHITEKNILERIPFILDRIHTN